MSLDHLPDIIGRLQIIPFEDKTEDGFGLVRTDTSPSVEVAVIHDGTDRGIGETEQYARLLAMSPVMLTLLQEALAAWAEQFDGPEEEDLSVSGADLVDWFAQWRLRVHEQLTERPPLT